MKKVYVVYEKNEYDELKVVKVYDKKEKAEKFVKENNIVISTFNHFRTDLYVIQSFKVQ